MTKRLIICMSVLLLAAVVVVVADNLRTETLTISYDPTNKVEGATRKTAVSSAFKGEIVEVQVAASSGVGTGIYSIVSTPLAGATLQTIASNAATLVGTKLFRPYQLSTKIDGVPWTNWVPFILIGEDITFTVTNKNSTVSNVVYTAVIKYRKDI